jgi:predicted kinase
MSVVASAGLPFHPTAEAVLGPLEERAASGPLAVRDLVGVLAAQSVGLVRPLALRLGLVGPDGVLGPQGAAVAEAVGDDVGFAVFCDAGVREAERMGAAGVLCEHLLLGLLRLGGDAALLARARQEFQLLRGERALDEYEKVPPVARPAAAEQPFVVLVAGAPGTGKSTLAEAVATALRAPVFSADWQFGALVPFGAIRNDNGVPLGDVMLTALTVRQLQLGLSAILDTTGHQAEIRRRWRSLAERHGGRFVGVECVCSDESAHRGRVEGRVRGIPGWPSTVTWEHVGRAQGRWELWDDPHLVVDSAVTAPEAALRRVLAEIRAGD